MKVDKFHKKEEKEKDKLKKFDFEQEEPLELLEAIDEAIDHVNLMSAIDEAFGHVEFLSAIDEALDNVNMIESQKDQHSWGTIALSACGVAAAIGGAGYLAARVKAFKQNDDVYESLV